MGIGIPPRFDFYRLELALGVFLQYNLADLPNELL
jgi:hypothetical protein